jgi:hypothetical protein
MPTVTAYPRWINPAPEQNLREVGRNLFVGAELAPLERSRRRRWAAVIDLYGSSLEEPDRESIYSGADLLLHWPFLDGDSFPVGALDATERVVRLGRVSGPVLLHCHAGLSRSASAAYAMLMVIDRVDPAKALKRVQVPGEEADFPRTATLASARKWVQRRLTR